MPQVQEVIGSGGGLLASPLWMQIVADVLNRPLMASAEPEATSRGAALLALEAMGVLSMADVRVALGDAYEPDARRHEVYARAMERQGELYKRMFGSDNHLTSA